MVATKKVESENEETWEKVRARAMVTTKPRRGMAKLGQQIAQLMAALTLTGWGSGPTSAPSSPKECGHRHRHSGRGYPSCSNSCNSRVALAR